MEESYGSPQAPAIETYGSPEGSYSSPRVATGPSPTPRPLRGRAPPVLPCGSSSPQHPGGDVRLPRGQLPLALPPPLPSLLPPDPSDNSIHEAVIHPDGAPTLHGHHGVVKQGEHLDVHNLEVLGQPVLSRPPRPRCPTSRTPRGT